MKVSLHPGAEQDLVEAAAFYEKQASPALAARFIMEFKRVAELLLENPEIGTPGPRGRRSFSMRLFPYALVYRPVPEGILILVVRHHRRRPGHGTRRT